MGGLTLPRIPLSTLFLGPSPLGVRSERLSHIGELLLSYFALIASNRQSRTVQSLNKETLSIEKYKRIVLFTGYVKKICKDKDQRTRTADLVSYFLRYFADTFKISQTSSKILSLVVFNRHLNIILIKQPSSVGKCCICLPKKPMKKFVTIYDKNFKHSRYLSALYSHPKWPKAHPCTIKQDLRKNVKDNWMWLLLTPSWMYNHVNIILDKRSRGQPVSFTDFFGYLVGETILKDVSTQIPLFQASLILAPSRGEL